MSVMEYEPNTKYDAVNKFWYTPYKHKISTVPDASIGEIIYEALQQDPLKIAQVSATEHTKLTKQQLLLNAISVATYLRNAGIDQDDIVGIVARNTTHLTALVYALAFNGTAFHALNPIYEESTFQQLFDTTKPKIIFCDARCYEPVSKACSHIKIIVMKAELPGVESIEDLLQTPIDVELFRPSKLKHGLAQTLAILCSSGTTGAPKAVTISNSHKIFASQDILPTDIQYTASTLEWVTGVITLITNAVYGTTRIISELPFEPTHLIDIVWQYRITWLLHAPSHIALLLNCAALESHKLDSVRHMFFAGGRCTLAMQQQMQAQLRHGLLGCIYGFTEAGSTITVNYRLSEKPDAVGRLVGGYSAKIIDEQGHCLDVGQRGEICISNGQLWAGYIDNPTETRLMQDDAGWLHSGDIGYFDADHYLYLVDRKKDMLKYQNYMYYPQDIEKVVAEMPNVAEVCAFGIWNEVDHDAAAVAVVKMQGTQLSGADVVEYVKSKVSVKYKQLNGGAFIVDELIKSTNGKVNRRAVKEACIRSLASQ